METKQTKKIYMVANWKMNPVSPKGAQTLFQDIQKSAIRLKHIHTVVCPSFVHMGVVKYSEKTNFSLGAQTSAFSEEESLTGEIAPVQLREMNVSYVLVGHSERRTHGETNELVARKIAGLVKRGITPILCIGESKRDEKGAYLGEVRKQITDSLASLTPKTVAKIMIAYEPLWAVGKTGVRSAKGSEIEEMTILIRRTVADLYSPKLANTLSVLYGGSVSNRRELKEIIGVGGVNGCLVGRASLSAKTFVPLLEEAEILATQ